MHMQDMAPYEKHMGSRSNWKAASQDNSEQRKDMFPGHEFIPDLDQHSALFNPPIPDLVGRPIKINEEN